MVHGNLTQKAAGVSLHAALLAAGSACKYLSASLAALGPQLVASCSCRCLVDALSMAAVQP